MILLLQSKFISMLSQLKKSYRFNILFKNKIKIINSINGNILKLNSMKNETQFCSFGNVLTQCCRYNFVNFPISSKYYHFQLPTTIEGAIKLAQKQDKLNQKCYLLQYITEIVDRDPKLYKYDLQKFMIKQLSKWRDGEGRMQRLATIAWVIKKLKLRSKLSDLYDEILRRMDDEEWYVNFDESVKALQAFSDYQENKLKVSVMQKIERNLRITLDDVNMKYYQRICNSLIQANRQDSPLWDRIEHFVIRNLGMDYAPKTFFDIFKAFAITRNGTSLFYEMCQSVIYRGHIFNLTYKIRNNLGDFDSSGDYFAMMIQTYAIVNKYTPIPLSSDFLDYLYKSLMASRLQYRDIASLTKLITYMPQLQFHSKQVQNVIFDAINNKQFANYHSLDDIKQLYMAFEYNLGYIPDKLRVNVQKLIQKDMDRNLLALPIAIQLVQFVMRYRDEKQIKNSIMLIDSLNRTIQRKYKYLDPQEAKIVKQLLTQNKFIQSKVPQTLLLPKPKSKPIQEQL